MKYIYSIIVFLVLTSCMRFLIGEKKLTHNESTAYVKTSNMSKIYRNLNFYIIPIEKLKECRGYPNILYIGSENKYSFFWLVAKLAYKDEIVFFALPDSICINKYPNNIDDENKRNRSTTIVDNKMVVADY